MKTLTTLDDGVEIRAVPADVFEQLTAKAAAEIFDKAQYFYSPREHYSAEETQKIATLKQNLGAAAHLHLGAFKDGKIIGWSWGRQESSEVFYMVNSAVLPEHRNKGIYSALASTIVNEAIKLGFQIVSSKHVATNNAVLIPKLKAGFTISSFELSDQYGVLIQLRWYANSTRRKMLEFRAGGVGFDQQIQRMLKL